MINIPNEAKRWKQTNNSDLMGNIAVTKNINFDNEGYLTLSNSSRAAMHSSIDADFDVPADIVYEEDHTYLIPTWDDMFRCGYEPLGEYATQVTDEGVPSTDIETGATVVNDQVVISQDTDVDYYDLATNAWVDTNISLTADGQHPVVNFLSLAAVAVANVYQVKLYSTPFSATPTLITTLNLQTDFEITQMCYFNQNLYIATRHTNGGHAYMFVWNGQGSAAQQGYKVDSNMIFSICVHKDTIVLLTGDGELLAFNGGGFTQLDAFPIFYTDRHLIDVANIGMYKAIMKSNGDVLYILFSNDDTQLRLTNQPDGIWCYDEKVGLYHKYSLSNSLINIQSINTTAVDVDTNQITVASPAYPTGTEVFYRKSGTVIGGLVNETKYFVIKVDATHIKLATTKANAIAGTAIDLTTTGEVVQDLVFFPNIDYGQTLNSRTMTVFPMVTNGNTPHYGSDVLWGAEVKQRTLTGDDAMLGSTTPSVESRGYFVTTKIFSSEVTDTFDNLVVKYSPFVSEMDKIIVKYRTEDDRRDEINIQDSGWQATWTSTTTFTTTQADMSSAIVGDEIEILMGAAGGLLAHITDISETGGTYTVTIDETFDHYITGDKSVFVFRNWKKFKTISSTGTGFISEQLGVNGKFLQLKIELRGIKTRIEEVKVDNKYLLPASK